MRKQEFKSRKKVQRKRNRVFVGIVSVTIILIVIPLGTYFVADKAVTDAVNVLQVEEGGIIRQSPSITILRNNLMILGRIVVNKTVLFMIAVTIDIMPPLKAVPRATRSDIPETR